MCWCSFHSVAERLPSEWPQGSEACVGAEFGTAVGVGVEVGVGVGMVEVVGVGPLSAAAAAP